MKYTTVNSNNILIFSLFAIVLFAIGLFMIYIMTFPTITLDNGIIRITGRYGGEFNLSDIQSVDTVKSYPKIVSMQRGSSGFLDSYIGSFRVTNEDKTAKLYIYRKQPPYIKIRMKDNSLLLFNFKKQPDKTVEFYNQLKTELNNP